jgi:hypothetical protein
MSKGRCRKTLYGTLWKLKIPSKKMEYSVLQFTFARSVLPKPTQYLKTIFKHPLYVF